jgi:hypothetical protein
MIATAELIIGRAFARPVGSSTSSGSTHPAAKDIFIVASGGDDVLKIAITKRPSRLVDENGKGGSPEGNKNALSNSGDPRDRNGVDDQVDDG